MRWDRANFYRWALGLRTCGSETNMQMIKVMEAGTALQNQCTSCNGSKQQGVLVLWNGAEAREASLR